MDTRGSTGVSRRYVEPRAWEIETVATGRWRIRLLTFPAYAEEHRMPSWLDDGHLWGMRWNPSQGASAIAALRSLYKRGQDGDRALDWVVVVKQLQSPDGWLPEPFDLCTRTEEQAQRLVDQLIDELDEGIPPTLERAQELLDV